MNKLYTNGHTCFYDTSLINLFSTLLSLSTKIHYCHIVLHRHACFLFHYANRSFFFCVIAWRSHISIFLLATINFITVNARTYHACLSLYSIFTLQIDENDLLKDIEQIIIKHYTK